MKLAGRTYYCPLWAYPSSTSGTGPQLGCSWWLTVHSSSNPDCQHHTLWWANRSLTTNPAHPCNKLWQTDNRILDKSSIKSRLLRASWLVPILTCCVWQSRQMPKNDCLGVRAIPIMRPNIIRYRLRWLLAQFLRAHGHCDDADGFILLSVTFLQLSTTREDSHVMNWKERRKCHMFHL